MVVKLPILLSSHTERQGYPDIGLRILFYREPIAPTAVLSNNIKEGTSISSLLPQPMTMS